MIFTKNIAAGREARLGAHSTIGYVSLVAGSSYSAIDR